MSFVDELRSHAMDGGPSSSSSFEWWPDTLRRQSLVHGCAVAVTHEASVDSLPGWKERAAVEHDLGIWNVYMKGVHLFSLGSFLLSCLLQFHACKQPGERGSSTSSIGNYVCKQRSFPKLDIYCSIYVASAYRA